MVHAGAREVVEVDVAALPLELLVRLHRVEHLEEHPLRLVRRTVDRVAGVVVARDEVHLQVRAVDAQQLQRTAFLLGGTAREITEDPQAVALRQVTDAGEHRVVVLVDVRETPQPGHELVPEVQVGGQPHAHGHSPAAICSRARVNTSTGCAPEMASRPSKTKKGTPCTPIWRAWAMSAMTSCE